MSTLVANTIKPRRGDTVTFADCNVSVGGTVTYEDVTNIDAVGIVTARSGIKVSGIVTAIAGAAVTYYGSGSNLTGIEGGVENFVASGTISNGTTVIIKDDGTVGIVTMVTSNTPEAGTPVVFESAHTHALVSTFDPSNGKVVLAYYDNGNSGKGTAIVGTVSGTSISFGTAVVFEDPGAVDWPKMVYDSTNEKVIIAYADDGNSMHGTAIVGTVSGTSISFGSHVVYNTGITQDQSIAFSGSGKVVIAFRDQDATPDNGTAIVGTVSGTSISFGTKVVFNAADTFQTTTTSVGSDKVAISYWNGSDSNHGYAIVGTVSGTSISFGSAIEFTASTPANSSATYDSTNGKVVIAYRDQGNSNYGTAIVGTVSGTSISFGTAVVFESAATGYPSATYDSTNGKIVIGYKDEGNSNYGTAIVGTVSGTSISFGAPLVFNSVTTNFTSATYDSTNDRTVMSYQDASNSNYGTSVVYSATSQQTNLTTENYIGIAGEAIANAATGKINVLGGVNSGQSGLTIAQTYYVGQTGILTTTADTPSVVAGTSISSTEILIR